MHPRSNRPTPGELDCDSLQYGAGRAHGDEMSQPELTLAHAAIRS